MAGLLVPCPHAELCGALSHEYGSVASIECMMRTAPNPSSPHSLSSDIILEPIQREPTLDEMLDNIPRVVSDHISVLSEIMRQQVDHARVFMLQQGYLEANSPQVRQLDAFDERFRFQQGVTERVLEWVPPTKIVQTFPEVRWGRFSNRRHVPVRTSHRLAGAFTSDEQRQWMQDLFADPVDLFEIPGPLGPIYRSADSRSSMTIFIARALRIPLIVARVTRSVDRSGWTHFSELFRPQELIITGADAIGLLAADLSGPVKPPTIQALRRAISSVGAAELSYSEDHYVANSRTRSPWLMFPESARSTELAYIRAYPEYESPIPEVVLVTDTEFNSWVRSESN